MGTVNRMEWNFSAWTLNIIPLSIATPVRSSALGVVPNSSTNRQMKAVQLWKQNKFSLTGIEI